MVNSPRKTPITGLQFAAVSLLHSAEQYTLPSEDEMGAFARLFTGGEIKAGETEVCLWSQNGHRADTGQCWAPEGFSPTSAHRAGC